MMILKNSLLAGVAAIALSFAGAGSALAVPVTVTTGSGAGQFNAGPTVNFSNSITASFNYTGPLTFTNNAAQNITNNGDQNGSFYNSAFISNYNGSGILPVASANFNNVNQFLNSSGSIAGYAYGSLTTINLGKLAIGTTLTINHDDGIALYQNGASVGSFTNGPTTAVTESYTIASSAYDTILYYTRQNGTPSVLTVATTSVPEPVSMALLGTGLVGLGIATRRKAKRV